MTVHFALTDRPPHTPWFPWPVLTVRGFIACACYATHHLTRRHR